jgi:predicted transcriptional regulator
MSWEVFGWVWDRDIRPPARKLIAVAIADAADDEGICRLTHRALAAKCGLSYDSVRAHIRELELSGVLVREAQGCEDGSQGANEYRLPSRGGVAQ